MYICMYVCINIYIYTYNMHNERTAKCSTDTLRCDGVARHQVWIHGCRLRAPGGAAELSLLAWLDVIGNERWAKVMNPARERYFGV